MADELVYLRGSPWSLATLWALPLAGMPLPRLTEHEPGPGELLLRARLGKLTSSEQVTVPVLIRGGGEAPLTDSWDIIRWAVDNGTNSPSDVVPKGKEKDVRELVELSNVVLRFARGTLQQHGDGFPLKMLPWPIRAIPGLRDLMVWISSKLFSLKYSAVDSQSTEEVAKAALTRLDDMVVTDAAADSGASLLAGSSSLTAGDLFAAVAIESMAASLHPGVTVMALMPKATASYRKLMEAHPRLMRWRDAVFAELPEDVRQASSMEKFL